jgi:integrase
MARKGDGLYLRGSVWYLNCRIDGQRHAVRLGKGINRTVAGELANVKRSSILKGEAGIGRKKKDCLFDKAKAAFIDWMLTNKRPRTVRVYRQQLERLAGSFSKITLAHISSFDVERHKQSRAEEGARIQANREVAVLKNLFNKARAWGLYEGENPALGVKMLEEPKRRLRYLEPEEEHRLLDAAPEPLRTLILTGIHCGLRLQSEALTLRWSDVDLTRRTLTVQAGYAKSGQTRTVPLNSAMHAALSRLKVQAKSEFVFTTRTGKPYDSIRTGFESACTRARLEGVTPHTTRHSFATKLIASGVDLRTVQELGGWSSLRMLERYGHVVPARKAQAVEQLVEEFHNGIHNSEETRRTTQALTTRKQRHGEVAEWPKAAVC